jgi:hypothetical protein
LFEILHCYGFEWVKILIERDSEVHVLSNNESVDTSFGGILVEGELQVTPASDDNGTKLLTPALFRDDKDEEGVEVS